MMFEVRCLESNELEMAYDLYCQCFNREKKEISLPLLGMVVGAFVDNELIGIAQLDSFNNIFESKKIFHINSVCIREEHRNKGYGKRLLEECIAIAKDKGGSLINLTANKNRVYAHMMYNSLGFVQADTVFLKKEL